MIHAQGLVRTFRTRPGREKTQVRAVDGVDIDVAEGEVAGYDVVRESEQVRRNIGYVSQAGGAFRGARAGPRGRRPRNERSTACPSARWARQGRRHGAGDQHGDDAGAAALGILLPMSLGAAWLETLSDIIPFEHVVNAVRDSFVGDFGGSSMFWGSLWAVLLSAIAVWRGASARTTPDPPTSVVKM